MAEHSGSRGSAGRGLLRKRSERVEKGGWGDSGGITRSSPSSERDGRTGGAIRL